MITFLFTLSTLGIGYAFVWLYRLNVPITKSNALCSELFGYDEKQLQRLEGRITNIENGETLEQVLRNLDKRIRILEPKKQAHRKATQTLEEK